MSILSTLYSIPLSSLTLTGGSIGTSYIMFSGIVETQRGVIPFLNGKYGVNFSPERRIECWTRWYDTAHIWYIALSVISGTLNLLTAYSHPSKPIRQLTLYSAIFSLMVVPLTYSIGIVPINTRIQKLCKAQEHNVDGKYQGEQGEDEKLVWNWESKHMYRVPGYVLAWGCSLLALILEGRI